MSQLTALYRRSGSFLANIACKVLFNVSDLEAARFVSEMIGQAPALSRNEGTSQANTDLVRQQYSAGVSETARYLLDPSEVMRSPGNRITHPLSQRHPALPCACDQDQLQGAPALVLVGKVRRVAITFVLAANTASIEAC